MPDKKESQPFRKIIGMMVRAYGCLNRHVDVLSTPILREVFLALYFFYKKHLEDPFYGLIKTRPELFREGHIFDIGSNVGYTVSLFSSVVSPGFQVHAFEPEPKNIGLLTRVVLRKKLSLKVKVNGTAVGNRSGLVQLSVNPGHHADHRIVNSTPGVDAVLNSQIEVPCTTIDDYWKSLPEPRRVAFVKMDVQGFEPAVLEGMKELLTTQKDLLVALEFDAECFSSQGFSPAAVLEFLKGWKGKSLFLISKDGRIQTMGKIDTGVQSDTFNMLLAPETLSL